MREQRLTRAQAEQQLANIAEGCLGSDKLRAEAREALNAIKAGSSVVAAGQTVYRLSDDTAER